MSERKGRRMNSRTHGASIGLLASTVILALAAGAYAAEFVRVTAARGPIRAEATAMSTLVTTVPRGTLLEVVAKTEGWYRVLLPADKKGTRLAGYIQSSLVTPEPAAVEKPTGAAVAAPQTPRAGQPGAPGTKPAGAPPRKPSRYTFRGFGAAEYEVFQATDSFDAIFGNSTGLFYGAGAEVSVGPQWFVQGRVSHTSKKGQRAFVFNGEVSRLGVTQTVSMTPIDVSAGYRLASSPRFTPYVAGGIGVLAYREEAASSDSSENTSGKFVSYLVAGGVEVPVVAKWFSVAGEFQYRSVPGAIGKDGISKEFGETNLGGISLSIKFLLGRQPPRRVRPPKPVTAPAKPPVPKR